MFLWVETAINAEQWLNDVHWIVLFVLLYDPTYFPENCLILNNKAMILNHCAIYSIQWDCKNIHHRGSCLHELVKLWVISGNCSLGFTVKMMLYHYRMSMCWGYAKMWLQKLFILIILKYLLATFHDQLHDCTVFIILIIFLNYDSEHKSRIVMPASMVWFAHLSNHHIIFTWMHGWLIIIYCPNHSDLLTCWVFRAKQTGKLDTLEISLVIYLKHV